MCTKLRDSKLAYNLGDRKLPYKVYRVHFMGLSDLQKATIPEEKQQSLIQMLTKVGQLTDEIISNLAIFASFCENNAVSEELQVVLTSIYKVEMCSV